ncbi:beta-hydroxyacyl-ACP dehydratase [Oleomonas cavernae]|uniref:Beta-hydroxyacyl-ACP dehydratase n=1 Tax=Oleomonas cavernae TaxID=2320859 RepID=A0A418VTI6_9PROT|nr:3-hydroxyacyl-ACP dehydratase FabZ family protein [Oleomonas cavernae]RJF80469.1 beta-hydroxyacyl-ACP dehydratase [Oleomonas cavernae]
MRLEYFQMVDRIEAMDLDAGTITCRAVVPMQSPVFEGHFPGHPLMPGVLLLECMAQTGGHLILARNGYEKMAFLAQADRAKFRSFIVPGDVLEAHSKLTHEGSGYAVCEARLLKDGKTVADAEIRYRVVPFPSLELKEQMLGFVRTLGHPDVA